MRILMSLRDLSPGCFNCMSAFEVPPLLCVVVGIVMRASTTMIIVSDPGPFPDKRPARPRHLHCQCHHHPHRSDAYVMAFRIIAILFIVTAVTSGNRPSARCAKRVRRVRWCGPAQEKVEMGLRFRDPW